MELLEEKEITGQLFITIIREELRILKAFNQDDFSQNIGGWLEGLRQSALHQFAHRLGKE